MTGLVLVVGCPRSGTTWLEQMLLTHPAAVGIPEGETSLFLCLSDLFANMARKDGTGLAPHLDRETFDAAVTRFCDRLIDNAVAVRNPTARVFVEKTPGHAFMLRRIAALYPDVHVVHIIRDGRDVARSLAELSFGASSVREGAETWRRVLESVAEQRADLPHLREVRYENLLASPDEIVCSLFEWLDLPVGASTRDTVAGEADRRVSQFDTTGPVGAGKWRTLPRQDIADIYAVAGELLVTHGYVDADELARWSGRPVARLRSAVRAARRLRTRAGQSG